MGFDSRYGGLDSPSQLTCVLEIGFRSFCLQRVGGHYYCVGSHHGEVSGGLPATDGEEERKRRGRGMVTHSSSNKKKCSLYRCYESMLMKGVAVKGSWVLLTEGDEDAVAGLCIASDGGRVYGDAVSGSWGCY